MNVKQLKYIHVSLNNQDGKWKRIALGNLAESMIVADLLELEPVHTAMWIKHHEERLKKLKRLDAPPVLIQAQQKQLAAAHAGKLPAQRTIANAVRKKQKKVGHE